MTKPAYIELHTHSCFSLLDGVASPDELMRHAAYLGMPALALTDHDALYGAVALSEAGRKYGVQPIFGAELTLATGHHLTLLVENETGWRNLCYLITAARQHAPKGQASLPVGALEGHTGGLIALSGCRKGEVTEAIAQKRYQDAQLSAKRLISLFGRGQFWLELQHHALPFDNALRRDLVALGRHLNIGWVATNNVHYIRQEQHELQDVLVCIRHNTDLENAYHLRRRNSEYYLKSGGQMAQVFVEYPEAISNTLRIAERCQYQLQFGLQDLPAFPTPDGLTAEGYLRQRCQVRLTECELPSRAAVLLSHELDVIARSGLANYFLIVADIIAFAHREGILCQGRGSAANSLVAYLLDISPVDPLTHNLVFERFLSDERVSVPDIDIDFDAGRREEVIQYVYRRYGADYTGMACTFITYRHRSAIRDVGKALGLPAPLLEEVALWVDRGDPIPVNSPYASQLKSLVEQIDGLPRHLGIHNGGMVITGSPLSNRLPLEPATMPDRQVVQWDKDSLETAGIVKIDLLGLRMLSAIGDAVNMVSENTGTRPDLSTLPFDDPALFQMMTQADTVGVFQVESRAQAQTLPRLKPQTFNDLIVSISLIRPGPVQGNMVHPYLRRRAGVEQVSYPHPLLEASLEETLGVILFQEQVLKVGRDLAGLTAGQGEVLRRALGDKRPEREVEKLRETFIEGAQHMEVSTDVATQVFDSLKAFAGYSFPKSHAAAFAVLVYQSAWLKKYWPAQFIAALLSNQPMGFWTPAVLVNDARRHGIPLLGVDIHRSRGACTVEDNAIRIGLSYIKGIGEKAIAQIEYARHERSFEDIGDFCRRVRLAPRLTENLILAGAFDQWGIERRKLIWEAGRVLDTMGGLPLSFPDDGVALPPLSELELHILESQVMGLTTGKHIMEFYQDWMQRKKIMGSRELLTAHDGQRVQVAGQTVMHQAPPTAKGFHFITLEDTHGMMNVIVSPRIYQEYRHVIRHSPLLMVKGELHMTGQVADILCKQASLPPILT
jgi:error-prone DNA polymerase